jgi:DegV family protein with EDD domain
MMTTARQGVHVVTDSTSDIPRDVAEALGITVIPLTIQWGEQSFRDGIDIGADEFYARLASTKDLPRTSQPPPALFEHAYEHLITQGDIVSVHLSHKFSGTVEAARRVAAEIAPDRIAVVDTGSVSMGLGMCVLAAARAAKDGASLQECEGVAQSVAQRVHVAVAFETLEYLRRGGRIGRASAFLGGLLRLQPVLTVKDGEAFPVTRARSRRKAIDELCALVTRHERVSDIAIAHTTTPDEAHALAERIRGLAPAATLHEVRFGPVLGTHGGPGMLGVAVVEAK